MDTIYTKRTLYFGITMYLPFVFPPDRTFGNLGRNTVIGPGIANFDFSLSKKTAVSEDADLQFRFEAFNLFNRPNLGRPASVVFSSNGSPRGNAGFISSPSTTSRQIQFGLRLIF